MPKGPPNLLVFPINRRFLRLLDLRQMRAQLKPRRHNCKSRLRRLNHKLKILPRRSLNTIMFRHQRMTPQSALLALSGNPILLYRNH